MQGMRDMERSGGSDGEGSEGEKKEPSHLLLSSSCFGEWVVGAGGMGRGTCMAPFCVLSPATQTFP